MKNLPWLGILLGFVGVRLASAQEKVGQGVNEILQREGGANVVIALVEPPSMRASQTDLPILRSEIASLQAQVLSTLYASDYRERHRYRAVPALAGRVSRAGLAELVANPNVVKIDLDVGGTGSLANSVPLIRADDWHALGVTGRGVVVAVLDTGIDTDHVDLADDLVHQECFLDFDGAINGVGRCPNGSDRQSGAGAAESGLNHGVMTTGIITSRGTVSSVGVAPDAKIVSIKVLDNTQPAGTFAFFSELVAALDFIINNRPDVKVINMSLGTFALFTGNCDSATAFNMAGAAAINTLRANGVIAFASSGNNGSGTQMTSPACISNVVSVGATNNVGNVAAFTNSNASLDLMAPGVGITSTAPGNGIAGGSGTSFASPHAAGCAALFVDAGVAVTPAQIEARLKASTLRITDPKNGLAFPRLDCFVGVEIVNDLVSVASLVTSSNPTPVPNGPAGTFGIITTFTNTSSTSILNPFFGVVELSGGNLLLNADSGPGGVGATLTPNVGADRILSPGESFNAIFVVGLQSSQRFTFFVNLSGVPGP